MRKQEVHVPNTANTAGGIKDVEAFKRNIRRLSSLADLLGKGSETLTEVLRFLKQATEEIEMAERSEQLSAQAQEQLAEEKAALITKLALADEDLVQLRAALVEREHELSKANAQLEVRNKIEQANADRERELADLRAKLNEITQTNAKAVSELQAHTRAQNEAATKLKESEQKESELARQNVALKTHVQTLEAQLAGEKERRTRLMEVVKAHEVTAKKT